MWRLMEEETDCAVPISKEFLNDVRCRRGALELTPAGGVHHGPGVCFIWHPRQGERKGPAFSLPPLGGRFFQGNWRRRGSLGGSNRKESWVCIAALVAWKGFVKGNLVLF